MPIDKIFYFEERPTTSSSALGDDVERSTSGPFSDRGRNGTGVSMRAIDYHEVDGSGQPIGVIEFRPLFRAALVNGEVPEGFGIRVNSQSGVVSFITVTPQPLSPNNFIIEALVSKNTGGVDPLRIVRAPIRVHVHAGVKRLWLTPNPMTLRRLTPANNESSSARFTVRAEFTDNTVRRHHRTSWSGLVPRLQCRSGGRRDGLTCRADQARHHRLPGATIKITASWQGMDAEGKVRVEQPWESEPAMPKAELVDGHPDARAGTIDPGKCRMSSSSARASRRLTSRKLEPVANMIVHHLKTDPLTRPFDLFATSINFWRVAVPAPVRGASVRSEGVHMGRGWSHDGKAATAGAPR